MITSSIVRTKSTPDGKTVLEVGGRPFFELNPMGTVIWTKLEQGWPLDQIILHLATRFDASQERITNDVNSFVELLRKNLFVHDYVPTTEIGAEVVWNRGIAARCDWRLPDEFPAGIGYRRAPDPIGHLMPPHLLNSLIEHPEAFREIKDGDLVWVRPTWLQSFIDQVLPVVNAKFILATGDSDSNMPSQFLAEALEILEHPNVLHWYAQNCDGPGFQGRMSPLPIGVDFHTLSERAEWGENIMTPQQQEQRIQSVRRQLRPAQERIAKVYVDFAWQPTHLYHPARRHRVLAQILTNECFVFQSKPLPRKELWQKWSEYAFVLSPHGVGLDCHRTWEALACGNIVLVPSSPLDCMYEGLPVIPIQDWREITPHNLDLWLDRYCSCKVDEERLTSDYWVRKMRANAQERLNSSRS